MLVLSLSSFAYSLLLLADYWEYEEVPSNIEQKFKRNITLTQMKAEIEKQIAQKNLSEARSTVQLATHFSYDIDASSYRDRIDSLDTFEYRASNNTKDFFNGFTSGKGNTGAAIAGAITSDFTVIGDVRDLSEQYQIHQEGREVNQLIIGLSGIGIGLTALTVGSAGTTAPIKAGASVLKFAGKTGRLSRRFSQELLQKAQRTFDWNKFTRLSKTDNSLSGIKQAATQAFNPRAMKPLSDLINQSNSIRKATSTIDTIHLLKYVETADDLKRINKIAMKHGKHTKGIMKFLGKGALRGAKILKKSFGLMMSALSLLLSGILSLYFIFPAIKRKLA